MASPHRDGKSPHELWYGKKPTVRHLRVWGCTAYAYVAQEKRSKFDAKAVKCIMIGYSESSKAWRLWDTERKRLIVSRDVTFNEFITVNVSSVVTQSVAAETVEVPVTSVQPPTEQHNEEKQPAEEPVEQPVAVAVAEQEQAAQPVGEVVDSVRRSARHHRQPGEWWKANSSEQANIALSEPQTYQQAVSSPEREKWLEAINAEYESLNDNGTWELVERPKGRKLVSCKWVFKVKHNADGTVDRYKARLVARGFTQTEGVDYHETYAPVVKMTSIRVLLSIVAIHDLELHQMDVKTAFLNGHLEEEIYMQQPEGFIARGNEHLVCKLKRTLYGLKQSPRVWYQTIDKFFCMDSRAHCSTQ